MSVTRVSSLPLFTLFVDFCVTYFFGVRGSASAFLPSLIIFVEFLSFLSVARVSSLPFFYPLRRFLCYLFFVVRGSASAFYSLFFHKTNYSTKFRKSRGFLYYFNTPSSISLLRVIGFPCCFSTAT